MLPNLSADFKRYYTVPKFSVNQFFRLVFSQEIWAITVYRFGSWVHYHFHIPLMRIILKIIVFFLEKITEIISGISIPSSVKIDPGLYIGHFGGIIVNGQVKIGKNFSIGSGVVIGTKGFGNQGVPEIGDNVYIGSGAKVLGGIRIGNNVKIGANAVVLEDVPEGALAVGVPAVIKR